MSDVNLSNKSGVAALQTNLSKTNDRLGQAYERLSSGLRINKISDDPAGKILADRLDADSRIYTAAIKNVNDGISLVNTADDATSELGTILIRLKELSVQAYNGATTSTTRSTLHTEAMALASEYDRIVSEASFNTRKLLDGSLQNMSIQAGYGAGAGITFTLGNNIADLSATITSSVSEADGTFNGGANYAAFGNLSYTALADFTGDGNLDILNARSSTGSFALLVGNGDGTFLAPVTTAVTTSPTEYRAMVALDLNGDSKQDFVAISSASSVVEVFLGNGNGTFSAAVSYGITSTNPHDITYGDVNNDGKNDLVIASTGNGKNAASITTLLGNGNGTFAAPTTFGTQATATVELADLNGDSKLDIVYARTDGDSNDIRVLLGNGNNTFNAATSYSTATPGYPIKEIAVGDVNGDGFNDVVSSYSSANPIFSIVLGNGDGTFKAETTQFLYGGGGLGGGGIKLQDLNADGDLDIVANYTDDIGVPGAGVFLNDGNGTFTLLDGVSANGGNGYAQIGDFNNDGAYDIVTMAAGTNGVYVSLGNISTTGSTSTNYIDLYTQASALTTISIIDTAVSALNIEFGTIAANESRLETAVSFLGNIRDTLNVAKDKILNVDVAEEAAVMLRERILQDVTGALLAQANQDPGLVMSLLK